MNVWPFLKFIWPLCSSTDDAMKISELLNLINGIMAELWNISIISIIEIYMRYYNLIRVYIMDLPLPSPPNPPTGYLSYLFQLPRLIIGNVQYVIQWILYEIHLPFQKYVLTYKKGFYVNNLYLKYLNNTQRLSWPVQFPSIDEDSMGYKKRYTKRCLHHINYINFLMAHHFSF